MKKKIVLSLLIILLTFVAAPLSNNKNGGLFDNLKIVADHDLNYTFDDDVVDTTYPYNSLRSELYNNTNLNISNHLSGKKIMIEDSLDLYNWSVDVSYKNNNLTYAKKQELLSQDYVLGNNIDYSERKSDRFFPIGYFDDAIGEKLEFKGSFDGRGFEIKNLYFVVFYEYSYFDNLSQTKTPASYLSMFNYNNGTIKNLGLINPIIDLENELPTLQYFSYLVGENTNTVNNVYVEDNRGAIVGGLRALASQVDVDNMKSASGIVHTNKGTFTNSYFAGEAVVNDDYKSLILEEPLVYSNTGTISNLVYASSIYSKPANNGFGEANLKNTSSLSSVFEYYPDDGYPKLYKLDKNASNFYKINSAVDLIYFSMLIELRSVKSGVPFNESDYVLENSINLNDVSNGAYKTPKVEFQGNFTGNVVSNKYPQINNLTITEGVKDTEEIYFGMFSTFSGKFIDIAFYNAKIKPNGSLLDDVNGNFYIGFLAGVLNNAEVRNVFIEGEIDLASSQVGAFNVGGLAGEATGVVERILFNSNSVINVGTQSYDEKIMNSDFTLGGIIGKTGNSKLTLYNSINHANITGLNALTKTLHKVNFYFGGVVGYVNNTLAYRHNIGLISNKGRLTAPNITNVLGVDYYLAGVIGFSNGNIYDQSNVYGKWTNSGEFSYSNLNTTTANIAGVVNSNHNVAVEFIKVYNDNNLSLNNSAHNVSSLVNHLTNVNLTISQAKSSGNYNLNVNNSVGLAVYLKETNPVLTLNYVEVYNNLIYNGSPSSQTFLAGIVYRERVNFLNVTYGGEMDITFSGSNVLWVSGFTHMLTSDYYIKNSINEGSININYGSSSNLYVGGFVNRNLSGDLHNQDSSIRPKATTGILNSINLADIEVLATSTGRAFVGGIVTLNGATTGGSIQDAINAGNIIVRNSNDATNPTFGGENEGGVVTSYNSGVTVGGIAAMAVYGQSRIFDTSNKGNIIGIAENFVRSGGVLGSALREEAANGGLPSGYFSNQTGNNQPNNIVLSIVSNGINDGKIQAITEEIGSYGNNTNANGDVYYRSGDSGTGTNNILDGFGTTRVRYQTRTSTNVRPGVNSAAGGVIGYGLSKMYRMINHGEISATDVAGGVVGATSVVRNTTVNINTAINYGDVRAIRTSDYSDIYDNKIASTSNFYDEDDAFLYPNTRTDIRLMPENKRGFGGVFGRLQRAAGATMTSIGGSFNYVVNMNENIDLIGRLDQVYDFTSTTRFFIFAGAIYYSAKENDTTQAVFTGYQYERRGTSSATFEIKNYQYQYMTDPEGYPLYRVRMTGGNRYVPRGTQSQNITVYYEKIGNLDYVESHRVVTSSPDYNNTSRYTRTTLAAGVWSSWLFDDGSPKPTQTNDIIGNMSWGGGVTAFYNHAYNVPEVTELPAEATSTRHYVYNPYFVMRDETTTIGPNQYVTDYIYYAEQDLLAPRHALDRKNGMYVLSSSSGSNYGAVLPKNFVVNKTMKISSSAPNYLDYENVSEDYLISGLETSYGDVFRAYESLYQTNFNDKSALLKEGQNLKIKDKNYQTEVFYQSDDFTGNIITFVVNKDMINPSTTEFTLDFELLRAVIPEGALIANINATQAELLTFNNNNPGVIIATGSLAPNLSITINDRADLIGKTVELGNFTSYSQAAINDSGFMPHYKTTYTVYLEVLDTTIDNPVLNAIRTDNNNYSTENLGATKTITNRIGLRINDNSNKLQNGYVMDDFMSLYYYDGTSEHLVDEDYYQIISIPKTGTQFTTDVYFSELLRPGSYRLKYRYYESDVNKVVYINYNRSYSVNFVEFVPYTSKNYVGTTADIDFGYDLANINGFTMNRSINTEDIPIYLAGYYVYELSFLESFVKTDFFEFDNITTSLTMVNGYRRYQVNFRLGSSNVLTKYIQERTLSPNYYKDNSSLPKVYDASVGIDVATTTATREAENTILSLDYKLPQSFYNSNNFIITYTYDGGSSEPIDGETNLIYSTFTERLNLVMRKDALPGEYVINVKYLRGGTEVNAGRITVTKLAGTSGYITNIKFSRFVVGNEYPSILVVNSDNTIVNPNPNYNLGVYYNGINYSGADVDNQKYIRIDGTVARIPLNYYMPVNITNYLPDGAMIKRKIYTSETTFVWSELVDGTFSAEDIQEALATDFTLDPKTGAFTEEKVYIEYMVVPENEKNKPINTQQGITYFISVSDITYTFLAMFNFWYEESGVIKRLDNVIDFDETLTILSMYNYQVSKNGVILEDSYPESDIDILEFDKIEMINSRLNMFYYIDFNTKEDYLYQVGNNLSGFYNIRFILPKGYVYKIYVNNYDDEENLLPSFSDYMDGIEGYFYYINTSSITRTRYFHVVVEKGDTPENSWGLTDNNKTWED